MLFRLVVKLDKAVSIVHKVLAKSLEYHFTNGMKMRVVHSLYDFGLNINDSTSDADNDGSCNLSSLLSTETGAMALILTLLSRCRCSLVFPSLLCVVGVVALL